MLLNFRYQIIKFIEKIPAIQIIIYNNLNKFKFLFPHDKDYFALRLLFNKNETRDFIDVGGNIGLSSIGFRELGFNKNNILIFEPDTFLIKNYLSKVGRYYKKIKIYPFGLSNKNQKKKLYKAYYKNYFLHFNNSFSKKYIKEKIKNNYPNIFKKFKFKSVKYSIKQFDKIIINSNACFVKIDVEGLDFEVVKGMKKFIKRFRPVLLIEYNQSNFIKIYKFLKKNYKCYIYDFSKNKLKKLNLKEIDYLKSGKLLEKKFKKNSVNLFFISNIKTLKTLN